MSSAAAGTDRRLLVERRFFTFSDQPEGLPLDCGARLGPITLAYETLGELNADRSNAILVLHALTGDAHVAGVHTADAPRPGWWDNMVGPGRPVDTDRYFVICSNILGGCSGSTGPGSLNPATGRPYGLSFPMVTIRDMVRAQKELIDHLGITRLLSVIGGSVGGMQVLRWCVDYPEMLVSAIPLATTTRHSAQAIAFNEVARQAIMADPAWQGGDYYGGPGPAHGLAVARITVDNHQLQDRIALIESDGLQNCPGPFQLILCNPPYVNASSMSALPPEYRAEPQLALAGGTDGMDFIRQLLRDLPSRLSPDGVLVLEIGHERAHFEAAFPHLEVVWLATSAGHDQVLLLTAESLAVQPTPNAPTP